MAVDFSDHSLRATGIALAPLPGSDLVLLHTYELPFEEQLRSAGVSVETLEQYRYIAQRQAERAMQSFLGKAGFSSANVTCLVLHGEPASCIVQQEQERDCALGRASKRRLSI